MWRFPLDVSKKDSKMDRATDLGFGKSHFYTLGDYTLGVYRISGNQFWFQKSIRLSLRSNIEDPYSCLVV